MKRQLRAPNPPQAVRQRMRRWQDRFLKAIREVPNVRAACAAAGIKRDAAYRSRKSDPAFAEAWQVALDASVDELEGRAFQIALEGAADNHATVSLITFLLRAHKPQTYVDTQRHELLGGIVLIPAKREGNE